jgi:competence protein ComGC
MEFLRDLWAFLKARKKFWLLPIIVVLLLFGVLIVLTSGSAIAPFIYSIF